jgi:predicted ester cyclase
MPANRMGLKQLIAMFRTAFPDLLCTIEDEIVQGDKVAAYWTMRGTHKGLFLGNSPTNKPIVVQGLIYARIENGQVIESWTMIDQMGVLQQLGLVPPPR